MAKNLIDAGYDLIVYDINENNERREAINGYFRCDIY